MNDTTKLTPVRIWLPRIAAAAVVVTVLLPCLVSFTPELYFDVDPRSDAGQVLATALGPLGTAWLTVYTLVAAAFAMGVYAWCGGRVRWVVTILVAAGMAFAGWHMSRSYPDMVHAGPWIAAAAAGLALCHLGSLPEDGTAVRRWVAALLVAMLVPLALNGAYYILVEHPMTVEQFRLHEADFLRSRGWEAGSPQHELYVRRLQSPDVIGAFGLSNVLGSIVAAFTALGMGWLVAGACRLVGAVKSSTTPRDRGAAGRHSLNGGSGWWMIFVTVLVIAMGLVTLALTHSKGAMGGLVAGGIVLVVGLLIMRIQRWRWLPPAVALLLLVGAMSVVVYRGAVIGPPPPEVGVEGERSLLFRYQYWTGAIDIAAEQGAAVLVGIGPAGFKSAYTRIKSPLNPEEVTNAHSLVIDYPTMLGIGGVVWCAVLLIWLWSAGVNRGRTSPAAIDDRCDKHWLMLVGAVAAVLFGTRYITNFQALFFETALLWITGLVGFMAVAGVLSRSRIDDAWVRLGLFAAAAVLMVHNQIEMSFFQVSSALTVWGVVGLAGSVSRDRLTGKPRPAWAWLPAAGLLVLAAVMVAGYAAPVMGFQSRQAAARDAMLAGQPLAAIESLDAAGAAQPSDRTVLRWRVRLRLEWAEALVVQRRAAQARVAVNQAVDIIAASRAAGVDVAYLDRLEASVDENAAALFNDPSRLVAAAQAMRRVVDRLPTSLPDTLRLADLYWMMDEPERAGPLYRRAIELSELSYLDPAKGLNAIELERATQRVR